MKDLTQAQKDSGKFYTYDQLEGQAKVEAYESFAYDFVKNEWKKVSREQILQWLSQHWFAKDGGLYASY